MLGVQNREIIDIWTTVIEEILFYLPFTRIKEKIYDFIQDNTTTNSKNLSQIAALNMFSLALNVTNNKILFYNIYNPNLLLLLLLKIDKEK